MNRVILLFTQSLPARHLGLVELTPGGYLWMISYRIPFLMGAALGVVSLVAARWMRVPREAAEVPVPRGYAAGDAE